MIHENALQWKLHFEHWVTECRSEVQKNWITDCSLTRFYSGNVRMINKIFFQVASSKVLWNSSNRQTIVHFPCPNQYFQLSGLVCMSSYWSDKWFRIGSRFFRIQANAFKDSHIAISFWMCRNHLCHWKLLAAELLNQFRLYHRVFQPTILYTMRNVSWEHIVCVNKAIPT